MKCMMDWRLTPVARSMALYAMPLLVMAFCKASVIGNFRVRITGDLPDMAGAAEDAGGKCTFGVGACQFESEAI